MDGAALDSALHDGVEGGDVDTTALKTKHRRLEESLGAAEALVTNGNDLSIGKLVGLLEAGALGGSLDFLLKVEGDVAELLLDVTNDFALGGGREDDTDRLRDLQRPCLLRLDPGRTFVVRLRPYHWYRARFR